MTQPTIVPVGYENDHTDFLKVKCDRSGAVRQVSGDVVIPNATAAGAFVGILPFTAGARFVINDKSLHITDIDDGTDSLLNVGVIYENADEGTDDVDLFVLASTAGRAAGFIAVTNPDGLDYVTTGKGWLVLENDVNVTEAEGTLTFSVGVVYDQPTQ
jgi:hypothetical protein